MVEHPGRDASRTPRQLRAAVAEGTRATVFGLVASSLLAVVKLGAGILGNSYALIADGVESTLDIFSALLVWGGLRVSGAEPTDSFPYGRGKAEHLAALAVATMLLAAAVGIALGALREIIVPHEAPAAFTLPVLAGVVLAKETIYRVLRAKGRRLGSQALSTDAWHHRSDALTSLAAFGGISVALAGGEGFESADDWAALLACGVIAWNAIRLLRSAARDVLDVTAPENIHTRIRQLAIAAPGVAGVEVLRVRRSGLVFFVDIHVEVDGSLSVRDGHAIAHRVKDSILHSELPVLDALVHIEPAPSTQAAPRSDGESPCGLDAF
jgi:cation diffusion facilitator family transporter